MSSWPPTRVAAATKEIVARNTSLRSADNSDIRFIGQECIARIVTPEQQVSPDTVEETRASAGMSVYGADFTGVGQQNILSRNENNRSWIVQNNYNFSLLSIFRTSGGQSSQSTAHDRPDATQLESQTILPCRNIWGRLAQLLASWGLLVWLARLLPDCLMRNPAGK
ncbi:hypothetical protein NLG97_g8249 [Lecanicillium saksenae]|uniref:Uncharacterized protein n=1 Tax=Lecanicillium saksenae TaxID=468837 RepID=A0ACC1QM25_9HYPO|nr:hypothetical protein NLG97_g8249 [Lecanicillium saksenae]